MTLCSSKGANYKNIIANINRQIQIQNAVQLIQFYQFKKI